MHAVQLRPLGQLQHRGRGIDCQRPGVPACTAGPESGKGYWTNPGGYIEQLEAIEETIRREVREEAGVDAVVRRVVALRDLPRAVHNVYIAFEMEYVGGEPVPDGIEVDAAGFFTPEEIETMNVAPFTRWLLDAAANAGGDGLHADGNPAVPLAGYGLFRA